MSDQLSTVFESLPDAQPPRPFADARTVRRRGRRRARRQRAAAAAAVVVLTAAAASGTQLLLRSPDQQAAAAPTNPALITGADLGPGSWLLAEHTSYGGGGGLWYWAGLCGGTAPVASLAGQEAAESITFVDAPRQVTQTVERYTPGRAAANLADIRATVASCTSTVRIAVIQQGFAGQESLLVKVDEPAVGGAVAASRYVAVTRVRDAVATVAPVGFGAAYTRELTGRVADRLG